MKRFRQVTALLLAMVMVLGLAACGTGQTVSGQYRPNGQHQMQKPVEKPTTPDRPVPERTEPAAPTVPAEPTEPAGPVITPLSTPVEPDREPLEQIADLLGKDEDIEDLTDEELTDFIESELQTPEVTVPEAPAQNPVADPEENADDYDEQGAMNKPFDQIYPELVENQQVAYDDQTLLLKLPLSLEGQITQQMADAGVGELEQLFMVEEAAWYEAKLVLGTDVPAAGETIALGLTLRNRWGKGDDLTVTLDTLSNAGIPDPYITIRNPTVDYDSIGTYSTQDAGRIPYQPGSVNAQFTVMPAQEDPVCGLRLEYDPAVVECLSVGSDAEDAYLIINPNFSDGVIRFSYVKESGTSDETPLVTIRWKPRTGANSHFTLKTTLIDPVDRDHGRVEIDCPVYSSCIYLTETTTATCTQPGGTFQLCLGCGSRIPLDTVPALGHDYGAPDFRWTEDHERCTASCPSNFP